MNCRFSAENLVLSVNDIDLPHSDISVIACLPSAEGRRDFPLPMVEDRLSSVRAPRFLTSLSSPVCLRQKAGGTSLIRESRSTLTFGNIRNYN